ncbi:MAG: KamA family radical SAM protein [Fibrobacter sp.]|nr:KamA family radical SAM protein [Fibrobacter sp.]
MPTTQRNPGKQIFNTKGFDTGSIEQIALPRASNDRFLPSILLKLPIEELLRRLKSADNEFYEIIATSTSIQKAREKLFLYLDKREFEFFDLFTPENRVEVNITERSNAKECIRVLKSILRTENEHCTGFSALNYLRNAVVKSSESKKTLSAAFLCEIIALLNGINGKGLSFLAPDTNETIEHTERKIQLDLYANKMQESFQRFPTGLDPDLVKRQEHLKKKILAYYNANEKDWYDYSWQIQHIFTSIDAITSIVKCSQEELLGLQKAEQESIPVQITPYYLSLFNDEGRDSSDAAIRAQVLPSVSYCNTIISNRMEGTDMDYMGEQSTSPIEGITRRYPNIVILKVFDSCPQICVYCQRNWEIRDLEHGAVNETKIKKAIQWIGDHQEISEVLITGGDPLTLSNSRLGKILNQLADFDHIERIRIGTRTLVTLPFRINDNFLNLLRAFHKPGKREVVIITHAEHATELTQDVIDAVSKIRSCGIGVYNQQVFTYYNSKRFETAFLRKNLKLCGIDPYYTFNTKGKDETADFRVPIARLLQERKEEARLLPGIIRTDEPVFNVPRLGKSHLRAWQDHEPVMILEDGRRVYRFLPWESRLTLSDDYLYTDVSIYDYLKRLDQDGEDVDLYRTIWYYF